MTQRRRERRQLALANQESRRAQGTVARQAQRATETDKKERDPYILWSTKIENKRRIGSLYPSHFVIGTKDQGPAGKNWYFFDQKCNQKVKSCPVESGDGIETGIIISAPKKKEGFHLVLTKLDTGQMYYALYNPGKSSPKKKQEWKRRTKTKNKEKERANLAQCNNKNGYRH